MEFLRMPEPDNIYQEMMRTFNRPLKNVFEAADIRRKHSKNRSLCVINEHFEPIFSTVAATQMAFQRSAREALINSTNVMKGEAHETEQPRPINLIGEGASTAQRSNPLVQSINRRFPKLLAAVASSALLCAFFPGTGQADPLQNFIKHSRLELGGWVNGGATFNPSQSLSTSPR